MLRVRVHAADIQNRAAVPLLRAGIREQFPRLGRAWADRGYTGSGRCWIAEHPDWGVEVVQHPSVPRWDLVPTPDPASRSGVRIEYRRLPHTETERGFRDVLPRPCVVQWTCSWPGQGRRLSKDYGRLCETGEALIYTTMGRPMVRRLAHG